MTKGMRANSKDGQIPKFGIEAWKSLPDPFPKWDLTVAEALAANSEPSY